MPVDEGGTRKEVSAHPDPKGSGDLSYGRLAAGRTRTNNIGLPPKSELTNLPFS